MRFFFFGGAVLCIAVSISCIGVVCGDVEPMQKPACYKHITVPISQTVEQPLYDISALKTNQMRHGI